ncbi:hypothetical protein ANN_09363 [Periplaneta americana]|uniref:Uncharacterized protein n=1 Tax=Periplaneta americana TaxID=6978 RepID=A0ABQ8TLI2_PERAM|nr:hypothetical protein ANN_09363 [Periplaneta americana]
MKPIKHRRENNVKYLVRNTMLVLDYDRPDDDDDDDDDDDRDHVVMGNYEIFPRRPNVTSRMMTETRSAQELRDETRKTNATNTANKSDNNDRRDGSDMSLGCTKYDPRRTCEGRRPRGRPRTNWSDNIRLALKQRGADCREANTLADRNCVVPAKLRYQIGIRRRRRRRKRRRRGGGGGGLSAVKNLKVRIYKTVILLVVLYGCETWTLTLREEYRLRVFENKVLRKIFGAKRDEVTGEWRKLHNTELHALYSSPDIIRNIKSRRLRWTGHVARMGESRNGYRVLVGRPEGNRPLGRPRRKREDNIKMDLREVGYDDRDWINLAQDRDRWRAYVRAAMNLRVP